MDHEKHTSTPHRTAYRGLEYIFDGWEIKNALTLYEDVGIKGLYQHFKDIDLEFDTHRGVPQGMFRQIAGQLLEENRLYEAAGIIQFDPINHPTHPNDISRLASQFETSGDTAKAVELYSLALRLSPSNQVARQKLVLTHPRRRRQKAPRKSHRVQSKSFL